MIPDHLLREVQYIELKARRRVRAMRAGAHASAARGPGFEFQQHRPYREGDDIRRIDWNATARMGSPFIREAVAERDLQLVLVADLTRSMAFGSGVRSKHEALVLATASLLFASLADGIASGVLGFTDRVHDWSAPVTEASAAWTALQKVWAATPPKGPTRVAPVVRQLLDSLRRTTLVVLVSDFASDEAFASSSEFAVLAARHDVVAIVLEDPAESSLPEGTGFARLRDLESDTEVTVPLTNAVREDYRNAFRRRRSDLQRAFYASGVDHVFVNTQGDVVAQVLRLFSERLG